MAVDQILGGQVIGAGAGHEQPVAPDHAQGELVQLAIGGLPLRDVLLALDEGRRIEDHDIETLALLLQRFNASNASSCIVSTSTPLAAALRVRKSSARLATNRRNGRSDAPFFSAVTAQAPT